MVAAGATVGADAEFAGKSAAVAVVAARPVNEMSKPNLKCSQ